MAGKLCVMAHITVPDESTVTTFAVTTAQSVFSVPWTCFDKTDIQVLVNGVLLAQTGFTFVGNPGAEGGFDGATITLNTAVSNTTVTIYRDIIVQRTDDFGAGPVSSRDRNTALDRLTAMIQDTKRLASGVTPTETNFPIQASDFGARPSASGLVNRNSIQAAIDYCASLGGGVVNIDIPGYYNIAKRTAAPTDRALNVPKGVNIRGLGTGAPQDSGVALVTLQPSEDMTLFIAGNTMVTQTCTISNASPGVITATAHGKVAGDVVYFATTGGLPAPLLPMFPYYVLAAGLTADSFRIGLSGSTPAINTTTAGSGVHTLISATSLTHSFGMSDINIYGGTVANVQCLIAESTVGAEWDNVLVEPGNPALQRHGWLHAANSLAAWLNQYTRLQVGGFTSGVGAAHYGSDSSYSQCLFSGSGVNFRMSEGSISIDGGQCENGNNGGGIGTGRGFEIVPSNTGRNVALSIRSRFVANNGDIYIYDSPTGSGFNGRILIDSTHHDCRATNISVGVNFNNVSIDGTFNEQNPAGTPHITWRGASTGCVVMGNFSEGPSTRFSGLPADALVVTGGNSQLNRIYGLTALDVREFGAIGDNSTNNTTAIQAAINAALAAGGGVVYFPPGTYLTNTLTMVRNVTLMGAGQKATFIKLRNGQNTNLIETQDANTLLSTGLTPAGARSAGAGNWMIRDLTLDGNRANNTTGHVLAFWGYRVRLQDVTIREAAEYGIDSGWADFWDTGVEPVFPSMESSFFNVLIDTCGKHGWRSAGPHDFSSYNVIIIDCSLSADNIYSGLLTRLFTFDTSPPTYVSTAIMTGQFNTLHIWQRGGTAQRMRYCLEDRSGNLGFTNTHLEGARTANALLLGNDTHFDETCWFYSVWSDGTGSPEQNVLLAGGRNGVRGVLQVPGAGRPDCEGVQIGFTDGATFTASDCVVDIWAVGQNSAVINFDASGGGNVVRARGTSSTVGWTGTPNVNDEIDIDINLATTNARLIQRAAYSGSLVPTGTTQGTALQLTDVSDAYAVNCTSASANGVRLPAARSGVIKSIINVGTETLFVYPATGETLNGGGAISILPNERVIFFTWAAANWSSINQSKVYSGTLVATGTTQGTALQLTDVSDSYAVNSASVSANGVRLPAARPGAFKSIINVGSQDLYVYASTGETLNGGGALVIAPNNRAIFFTWAAANWSSVIN